VSAMDSGPRLTPAQERNLGLLRRAEQPVEFSVDFVESLRDDATEALAHFTERLDGATMFVTKHTLSSVHDCEAHFLAPDEFAWTPARAKGQVAHRAIQLAINWRGEPTPRDLVDERDFGRWVAGLSPADEADLRSMSIDRVTKFVETFPPLPSGSHPVTEAAAQWPLDHPILLRARVDISMGKPRGRESTKVIVDLKSGRVNARHREDLRFYALIETLVRDVPPRLLATFYLDSAQPVVEQVTEGVLQTALRRTLDGIHHLVRLQVEGDPPTRTAGASCRWCPLADDCAPGQAYLRGSDGDVEP
jgi:hypothetical protein